MIDVLNIHVPLFLCSHTKFVSKKEFFYNLDEFSNWCKLDGALKSVWEIVSQSQAGLKASENFSDKQNIL